MDFSEKDCKMIIKWTGIIENQEKSGLSLAKWCALNNVGLSTLSHYKKIIRDLMIKHGISTYSDLRSLAERSCQNNNIDPYQGYGNSTFYSVDLNGSPPQAGNSVSKSSGVRLQKNGFVIEIDSHFDEETLTRVMAVVKNA